MSYIWIGFFVVSFVVGVWSVMSGGSSDIFNLMIEASFKSAKDSVDVAFGLIGVLTLWMGFFKVAENSGVVDSVSKKLSPLFSKLMPEVPSGHPAIGAVTMNMAANVMGLDNAATPMGLQAMKELQTLNKKPESATDAQILFLVINASSVTLLPMTIFMYRAQQGATNPTSVFIPIIIATAASTLTGLLSVAWFQKIKLWNKVVLSYLGMVALALAGIIYYFSTLTSEQLASQSSFVGNFILFSVILVFLIAGARMKMDVFGTFIEGAKEGFQTSVVIIPYLVAMLVAIGIFRASGSLDYVLKGFEWFFASLGFNTDFVPALTTAIMKPLSGSGARAMMIETMKTYGVDSFPALVSTVIQGSTETTFYVLTVYFGSVGIKKFRHALICGLLADLAGVIAAILVCYWFFHSN